MKKRLLAMVLAVATTFSLVACGGGSTEKTSTGGKKEVVTIWTWGVSDTIPSLQIGEEMYEKENENVDIQIVEMGTQDLIQKIQTLLAAGNTKDLPEIIFEYDANVEKYLYSYPGALADLTDKIPYDKFVDAKTAPLRDSEGKYYGVPFDIGVTGFYYREDILNEAGFKAEDLEDITWDEFNEIGKVVLEKTGRPMTTINPQDPAIIRMMLQSAGSWYTNEEGNADFVKNDVFREALKLVKTSFDTGVIVPHYSWDIGLQQVQKGDVLGIHAGIWFAPTILDIEGQDGLWKFGPMPRMTSEGGTNYSSSGGCNLQVLDKSKNRDLAIDFLNKVFTDSVFYERLMDEVGMMASYKPAMDGDAYDISVDYFGGQKIYKDAAEWMKSVPAVNYGLFPFEVEEAAKVAFTNIIEGKDFDKEIEAAEKQAQALIDGANIKK